MKPADLFSAGTSRVGEPLPLEAIKTYRYLRLALVGLVVLLFSAVAIERAQVTPGCFQTSISGYYYTPVRAVFIGVLVTMGICLIALKGSTDKEDVLLNIAGMLAPVVGFVPTTLWDGCTSAATQTAGISEGIRNNVAALYVAGAVLALVTILLARSERERTPLSSWDRAGIAATLIILLGGGIWFWSSPTTFAGNAHNWAAIPMFGCLVAVVCVNGRHVDRAARNTRPGATPTSDPRYAPTYKIIAILMLAALAATILLIKLSHFQHAIIWIEVVLITLFGAFWVLQTKELWKRGLREG